MLVWPPGGHSGHGTSVDEEGEECACSQNLEVLPKFWPRFWGQGRSVAHVGQRRLLATGGLGVWLESGVSVWRSLRHIGCLWSAFEAFPATPLVHALINVGGRMYVPCPSL